VTSKGFRPTCSGLRTPGNLSANSLAAYERTWTRVLAEGRHYAAAAPAFVPPPDADLPDVQGLSDAQIQLISDHESKKSLEVYQHLSLESVDKAYQDAVQSVGI